MRWLGDRHHSQFVSAPPRSRTALPPCALLPTSSRGLQPGCRAISVFAPSDWTADSQLENIVGRHARRGKRVRTPCQAPPPPPRPVPCPTSFLVMVVPEPCEGTTHPGSEETNATPQRHPDPARTYSYWSSHRDHAPMSTCMTTASATRPRAGSRARARFAAWSVRKAISFRRGALLRPSSLIALP